MTRLLPMTRATLMALFLAILALLLPAVPARAAGSNTLTVIKTVGEGVTPGAPLGGITFRLNQVLDVDISDPDILNALRQVDPVALTGQGYRLGPDVDIVTGPDGRASATTLPDGVYLVHELPSRTGDVAWSVVSPFLVSLPQGIERVLEVHAKNQPITLTLDVTPATVKPGDAVTLTMTGSVTAPDAHGELHRYVMVLETDPLLLDLTVAPVVLRPTGCVTAASAVSTRAAGCEVILDGPGSADPDYTTRRDPATGKTVIEFTPKGLRRLAAMRAKDPGLKVIATITGRVSPNAPAGARMHHSGWLFADGWPVPADLSQITDAAAVSDVATNVVVVPVVPSPSATPPWPLPPGLLAVTGAPVTAALVLFGTALLGIGVWLLIVRRRRDDDTAAGSIVPPETTTTPATDREEACDDVDRPTR